MKTQNNNKFFTPFLTFMLLLVSILAFLYTYKDYGLNDLKGGLQQAHLKWIIFAMLAHLMNHALRAYRWGFMIEKQHAYPTWVQSFTAEMSGFFVNTLGLRLGELARCQRLKKMQNIPIKKSLAAVIIERVVDLLFFLGICVLVVILFSAKVKKVLAHVLQHITISDPSKRSTIIVSLILFLAIGFFLFKQFETKIIEFIKEVVGNIKLAYKANSPFFWGVTLFIWLSYFLLEYISLYALDSTSALTQNEGIFAGIVLFVLLNLSHIVPVSNGVGLYHALVVAALTYYNVPEKDAQTYALITHGIQTFNALVWGGLCLVYTWVATAKQHISQTPSRPAI